MSRYAIVSRWVNDSDDFFTRGRFFTGDIILWQAGDLRWLVLKYATPDGWSAVFGTWHKRKWEGYDYGAALLVYDNLKLGDENAEPIVPNDSSCY